MRPKGLYFHMKKEKNVTFLSIGRNRTSKSANFDRLRLCSKKSSNQKNKTTFTFKKFRVGEVKVVLFLQFDDFFTIKTALSAGKSKNTKISFCKYTAIKPNRVFLTFLK